MKTQRRLKCILLVKEFNLKRPNDMTILEKAKLWRQENYQGLGGRRMNRAQRMLRAVKLFCMTLTMVDTCHYTFVQTHKMYKPTISSRINYGLYCLASFTQQNYFQIHPRCCMQQGSLLFIAEQHSTVWIYHPFFLYSLLGCFHLSVITTKAAVTIYGDICFQMLKSGTIGSGVDVCLIYIFLMQDFIPKFIFPLTVYKFQLL